MGQEVSREELRELLLQCRWPTPRGLRRVQQEGEGAIISLGAFRHGGVVGIAQSTCLRPLLVRLLNAYILKIAPRATYTALGISYGVQLGWHRDKFNLFGSRNWLVPIGVFEVGAVRVLEETSTLEEAEENPKLGYHLEVSGGPVSFNPLMRHCVPPYTGERLVLVGYTPGGFHRLSQEEVAKLKELGFPVPEVDELALRNVDTRVISGDPLSWVRGENQSEERVGQVFCAAEDIEEHLSAEYLFLRNALAYEQKAMLQDVGQVGPEAHASLLVLAGLEQEIQAIQRELTLIRSANELFPLLLLMGLGLLGPGLHYWTGMTRFFLGALGGTSRDRQMGTAPYGGIRGSG